MGLNEKDIILVRPDVTRGERLQGVEIVPSYLGNVMVLAKRFKMSVEFVDTIFMRLGCQFSHTIRELRFLVEEWVILTECTDIPFASASLQTAFRPQSSLTNYCLQGNCVHCFRDESCCCLRPVTGALSLVLVHFSVPSPGWV